MQLDITFWVAAWCLMGLTFITATGAIILGAKSLDRNSPTEEDDH
ncbi:MAG: hypothetical protein AB8B55_21240 [Mariniblastus sp.]